MFLIKSCLGLFTAADLKSAPLLPKLRGHFAEFLNNASPAGLRILSLSTCVGLWYGSLIHYSGFSWHMARWLRYLISLRVTSLACTAYWSVHLLRLHRLFLSRLHLSTCVPALLIINECRNINLLPIDYASLPRLRGRLTLRR